MRIYFNNPLSKFPVIRTDVSLDKFSVHAKELFRSKDCTNAEDAEPPSDAYHDCR